jgi:hypothetical protein
MTVDTTKWVAVVHDGSTTGGWALARFDHVHDVSTPSVGGVGGSNGFIRATDQEKLDSIAPGGTLSYQIIQISDGTPQTARLNTHYTSNFAITDDGGGNRTNVDLADSGVSPGAGRTKFTVDAKGRITSATTLSEGDIPSLHNAKISDFTTGVRTVRLDQMAVPTADVNFNSYKLINVADPVAQTDAATKQYVDTTATGLTFKQAVRVASTVSVNLAAPPTTMDTVSLNLNDRILLKDQSDKTTNGIYMYNGIGSTLTRTNDANSNAEVKSGLFTLVTEGHANVGIGYVLSTVDPIDLGMTELIFVPFSSGGSVTPGNGIDVNGSTVSVHTASSSRIVVTGSGVDLATIGSLTPGTYQQFTVDAYGRITGTTNAAWQPSNAGLTTIAGLSINGFVSRMGANNFASRTFQPGTGIAIINGDGASGNPSISVSDNTTKQKITILNSGTTVGTRANVNLIPGTGAAFTVTDNNGSDRVDVTIGLTPGGGAAPSTSQYVCMATDASLTNERVLTNGTGINMVDGGSGNPVTISLATDFGTVP